MEIEEISFEKNHTQKPPRTIHVDYIFYHYLSKELALSPVYRVNFCRTQKSRKFRFVLILTRRDSIDYNWNDRVAEMIRERCELDHALSWLSTLGGAFSALGDYFINCALIAGRISVNQLRLALRLGDPMVASRCRLYYSLSLIQRGRFKLAKCIILEEYNKTKSATVVDDRLVKMCKGIWSKLQYEYDIYKNRKKLYQISINKQL